MTREAPEAGLLDAAFARSERMVGRRIAGEYVLVPIMGRGADVDSIFTLNRVGAFVWERFDGKTRGRDIVRALAETFEVESERAAEDYCEFVRKLRSIHAVTEERAR
jgi:coenzyme PQQ synthesis protein D (PqqD)